MNWEKGVSVEALNKKSVVIFKKKSKQIVIIQRDKEIYAIDNRCPHEGYPLSQGSISDSGMPPNCVLTCRWHNWKFDLSTGECLLGQDDVRTYPTKQEDGFIWVDLSPLPPEKVFEKVSKSLKKALFYRDLGQISRELARLKFNNLDPLSILPLVINWSYSQFEYGFTHAYAGLSSWLELYDEFQGDTEIQLTCLAEALDHIAFDVIRHEEYPYSQDTLPFSHSALHEAIENENDQQATQFLNDALQKGLGIHDLEKTLTEIALNHYNSFGHSLIYVVKTVHLIERLGKSVEKPLLLSLIRHLCYTTREDLIPDFFKYSQYLETMNASSENTKLSSGINNIPLHSIGHSMNWVVETASQLSYEEIYSRLLIANAKNLLDFDEQYENQIHQKVKDNVGWLDYTHGLTFSNAVRKQCEKYPELWKKGLLQMACFHGRNIAYLGKSSNLDEWFVENESLFWETTWLSLLDHGIGVPIFSVHLLKTSLAVKQEVQNNPELSTILLPALNRYLHALPKQKHTRRLVHQGIQLIEKDA